MTDPSMVVFLMELERQCRFAEMAFDDLNKSLRDTDPGQERFWFSIQSFLIATANISKILFPSDKSDRNLRTAEELRKRLSISDTSPIKPKRFRSHFEHYDERIEDWSKNSKSHSIVDTNIAPKNAIQVGDTYAYMRNFDPQKFELTFRDEEYEILPVMNEIRSGT